MHLTFGLKVSLKSVKNDGIENPYSAGQFHDEIILRVKKNTRHIWTAVIKEAIQRANTKLNMRREIDSDIDFDSVYSGIH